MEWHFSYSVRESPVILSEEHSYLAEERCYIPGRAQLYGAGACLHFCNENSGLPKLLRTHFAWTISTHANGGSSHDVYHGQSSPHWHERKFPGLVSAISRICTYREFSFFWNPNIFVS